MAARIAIYLAGIAGVCRYGARVWEARRLLTYPARTGRARMLHDFLFLLSICDVLCLATCLAVVFVSLWLFRTWPPIRI